MDELKKARSQIDRIDRQMQVLFEERMAISAEVAAFKKLAGLPVLDTARQREILVKNTARLKDKSLSEYYTKFMSQLMSLSRQHQNHLLGRTTVAFPGKGKAVPEALVQALFPGAEAASAASVEDVFRSVEAGAAAYGLVPYECSGQGRADGVLELCHRYSCYIGQMVDAPTAKGSRQLFLVLWHEPPQEGSHMAVFATVENEVGKLAQLIEGVAGQGANIGCIKVRPMKKKAAEATYYLELDLPEGDATLAESLLQQLGLLCIELRFVGRYERTALPTQDGAP